MELNSGALGYLQLNEEGAVLTSGGCLENDERTADVIMGLLQHLSHLDKNLFDDGLKKVSLVYDEYSYIVCLSNRKVHIVKKAFTQTDGQAAIA